MQPKPSPPMSGENYTQERLDLPRSELTNHVVDIVVQRVGYLIIILHGQWLSSIVE